MTYKPRRERRARGGKAAETEPLHPEHGHLYNAEGSPESKSITAEPDGFKHGGMAKKKKHKEGGKVEGHAARHHLGKRARGGHVAHEPHHDHDGAGHHGMSVSIHHHRKHGGGVEGEGEKEKPDERARGGHVSHKEHHGHMRARGGGTPFSHAHALRPPGNDKNTGPGEDAESIP